MEKKKYICHSAAKEQFDYKGISLGMGNERALYYSKSIGKRRVYRSSYPTPPANPVNDFVLFDFDDQDEAISFCNGVNIAYKDDFEPLEL